MPSLGKVEIRPLKYVDLFLTRCGWSNLYISEKEIMALKTLRIVTKRRAWLELWKNVKELNSAGGETEYQEKIKLQTVGAPLNAASNQTFVLSVLFSNGPWRGASTPSMSLHNSPALRIDLAPVMMITMRMMMTMMMVMMMMITMMIITLRMLLLI